MKLKRLFINKYTMFGDCDTCGHSALYHIPLAGCMKCNCGEFH